MTAAWFALAVVLALAELATATLALGLVAVAAALAGLAAVAGGPLGLQVAVFAAAGGVLLVGVRPVVRTHLLTARTHAPSGTDALPGMSALVTVPVSEGDGQVRLGGELWAARLAFPRLAPGPLAAGTSVIVHGVDGATLVVSPLEL